jgi:hypothetical protein
VNSLIPAILLFLEAHLELFFQNGSQFCNDIPLVSSFFQLTKYEEITRGQILGVGRIWYHRNIVFTRYSVTDRKVWKLVLS